MYKILKYIGLIVLVLGLMSNKSRQALRALEDGDFEKAIDFLEKSIEKDSLNPNIAYVYSVLYSTDSFPQYNVDTAHFFITGAIQMLDSMTEDHQKEMERAELGIYDFHKKKVEVDSLAWLEVSKKNKISGYLSYMSSYSDSRYVEQARKARYALEYSATKKINTWQAYQKFFKEFSDAEEAEEAKKIFDQLVYEEKTKSNSREDLEDFLIEFPSTPFRKEIEQRIFDLIWVDLDISSYYDFINAHHNPRLTQMAFGIMYHMKGLEEKKLKNFNLSQYKEFMDSVRQVEVLNQAVLFPIYQDKKYRWMNLSGDPFGQNMFDDISPSYLCGNVENEIIEVKTQNQPKLINRHGSIIAEGFHDGFEELNDGILIIKKNQKFGAMHVSGIQLLPNEFEDIKWLGSRFFACKNDKNYGLFNFGGKRLSPNAYDDIYMIGDYWIFERDEMFAVTTYDRIAEMIEQGELEFDFRFEEFEHIDGEFLIGFEEEYELMYDENLVEITPPHTRRINTRFETWVFESPEGYHVFNSRSRKKESLSFDQVVQNTEWLGLKKGNHWEVRSKSLDSEAIVAVDSLKLLGDDIAIIFRENSGMAIFPNREIVYIDHDDFLTSISDPKLTDSHFLVVKKGKESIVYKDGKELFRTDYEEVGFITENGFLVKEGSKYGAVNERGQLIMRVRYDAIGESKNGVPSVLYQGKFGGFNFNDKILISLTFDQKLIPYSKDLYIMKSEGKFGVISNKNEILVDPDFEEIRYWSDSSFLAKEDGEWMILTFGQQDEVLSEFKEFEYLLQTDNERIILFYGVDGLGVFHSEHGMVVPPVYTDIINVGN